MTQILMIRYGSTKLVNIAKGLYPRTSEIFTGIIGYNGARPVVSLSSNYCQLLGTSTSQISKAPSFGCSYPIPNNCLVPRGYGKNFKWTTRFLSTSHTKQKDQKKPPIIETHAITKSTTHAATNITESHSASHSSELSTHTHTHSQSHKHSLLGHSHSHTNSAALLAKEAAGNKASLQITWIGLFVNIGMVLSKGIGGVVFHSQALIADAVHAISDLFSDILTLSTVKITSKPKSALYPRGYGKVESLGAACVSGLLVVAGLGIGYSSVITIIEPLIPTGVIDTLLHLFQTHSHTAIAKVSGPEAPVDLNAAWIALASIFVKELLFRKTLKIGKETRSSILVANAWHHRVDSLTAVVAVLTISGSYVFGVNWLDAVGGLIVSTMVFQAGFTGIKSSFLEIIDRALDKNDERYQGVSIVLEKSLESLNRDKHQVAELKKLVVFGAGPTITSNISIILPPNKWENVITANDIIEISTKIKTDLTDHVYGLREVTVEVELEADNHESNKSDDKKI